MIAERIVREDIPGFMQNWGSEFEPRLYRLDPPLDGYAHVAILVCDYPGISLDFTEVYASNAIGGAIAHPGGGLAPHRRYPRNEAALLTHEEALAEMGYTITEPEE